MLRTSELSPTSVARTSELQKSPRAAVLQQPGSLGVPAGRSYNGSLSTYAAASTAASPQLSRATTAAATTPRATTAAASPQLSYVTLPNKDGSLNVPSGRSYGGSYAAPAPTATAASPSISYGGSSRQASYATPSSKAARSYSAPQNSMAAQSSTVLIAPAKAAPASKYSAAATANNAPAYTELIHKEEVNVLQDLLMRPLSQNDIKLSGESALSADMVYGGQLKAWIDMQVDRRVQFLCEHRLATAEEDATAARQEVRRMGTDLAAMTGTQAKLVEVAQKISDEVESLKLQVDKDSNAADIAKLTTGLASHERMLSDLRQLNESHKQEFTDLVEFTVRLETGTLALRDEAKQEFKTEATSRDLAITAMSNQLNDFQQIVIRSMEDLRADIVEVLKSGKSNMASLDEKLSRASKEMVRSAPARDLRAHNSEQTSAVESSRQSSSARLEQAHKEIKAIHSPQRKSACSPGAQNDGFQEHPNKAFGSPNNRETLDSPGKG